MSLDKIDLEIINAIRAGNFDRIQIPDNIKISHTEYKDSLLDLEQKGIIKMGSTTTVNLDNLNKWINIRPGPDSGDKEMHWVVDSTCRSNLPGARIYHSAAVVNDKIYVLGGFTSIKLNINTGNGECQNETDSVLVFDPSAPPIWQPLSPMNVVRAFNFAAIGASDGKIYVIGGDMDYQDTEYRGRGFWFYNPLYDTWGRYVDFGSENPDLAPEVLITANSAVEINGNIYTEGQLASAPPYSDIYLVWWDIYGMKWNRNLNLPLLNRVDTTIAKCGSKLYIIGGRQPNGIVTDTVEEIDPTTPNFTYRTKARIPDVIENATSVTVNGRIYVIGGFVSQCITPSEKVFEYNPITDTWRTMSPLITGPNDESSARFGLASVCTSDGTVYVIGGAVCLRDCLDPNATTKCYVYFTTLVGQLW